MVFYLIIMLAVSLVGMTTLLSVKRYELTTGRLMFGASRPTISKFASRTVFLFGTAIPLYVRWHIRRAYQVGASWVHRATARAVLTLEGWLESILTTVREKTEAPRAPGEASAFLREVAEHKKQLSSKENGRITEE